MAEIVEAPGNVGVTGIEIFLANGQRLRVKRLGLADEPPVFADIGENAEDAGRLGMVGIAVTGQVVEGVV